MRTDFRRTGGQPRPGLIDAVLFLLLLSGPPKFRLRDPTASLRAELDTVAIVSIGIWLCGLAWVLYRLYPAIVRHQVIPKLSGPQLLGCLCIVSLSFSAAISPSVFLTVYSLGQFAIMLTFAWLFVSCFGVATYLRLLFFGYVLMAVALLVAWRFAPDMVLMGGAGRLRGDLIAPAGPVGALGLVLALSGVSRLRIGWLVPAGVLLLVVLAASRTRTAYIALAFFLVLGFAFGSRLPVRKSIPYVTALLIMVALLDQLAATQMWLARGGGGVATFSDRLPLWHFLATKVLAESPVFGLGYYASSRVLGPQYNSQLGTAHSAFVEALVGGGIVGAAAFGLLMLVLGAYAWRCLLRDRGSGIAFATGSLLFVTLVLSLTGAEGVLSGPVGFTFWSLTALLPAALRDTRQAAARRPGAVPLPEPVGPYGARAHGLVPGARG